MFFHSFSPVIIPSLISFPLNIKYNCFLHMKTNSFMNCCDIRLTKLKWAQCSNTAEENFNLWIMLQKWVKTLLMKHRSYLGCQHLLQFAEQPAKTRMNLTSSLNLMVELFGLYFVWGSLASIIIFFTSIAVLSRETQWPSRLPPSDAWKINHGFSTCPLHLQWADFILPLSSLI